MRKYTRVLLLASTLTLSLLGTTLACTNVTLTAQDGDIMVGRSLEFGPNLNSNIMTSAEGRSFQSPSMTSQPGVTWKSKYGYVFLDFFGSGHPVDGMNEAGLSMGYLYLPGYTQYQQVPEGKSNQALSYTLFGDWLLGNFNNVKDVKDALKNIYVYATPATYGSMTNTIFPLHAVVTDASGKSITVEWHHGKMVVYDNPPGILTNAPDFNWQMNNLKNYANLLPFSPVAQKINGIDYTGTGQGAGAVGLPGDYSPPSRFVKIAYLSHYAFTPSNAQTALNLAQHIMNNVDIPDGAVRGVKGDTNAVPDTTQWVVFKDLTNKVLYYRSYGNTTLQKIDLTKLNFKPNAPQLKMPVASAQYIVNSTAAFTASNKP